MNTPTKRFYLKTLLLLLLLGLFCLPALADDTDYADRHQPGEKTGTRLMEATVRTFVDGDTTHFSVPEDQFPGGVLKGRYLAVNTPECTGKVEPFGQAASDFTREKLLSAAKILLESDSADWELDSTGQRTLVQALGGGTVPQPEHRAFAERAGRGQQRCPEPIRPDLRQGP